MNAGAVRAAPSTHKLYVNNQPADAAAYNIAGNNYFKLRDLGEMMDFGVGFTAATSRVDIDTEKPYAAETATPATGSANQGRSQSGTSSTMKEVSNNPGYFYDTSLLTIPADVNGATLPDLEQRMRNWELYMVDRINEERRNAGVNELVIDEDTMGFSQYWAKHMATNEFRHSERSDRREYAVAAGLSNLEPAEITGVTDKKTHDKVVVRLVAD